MTKLWNRIYSDFCMPSRLNDYRALLERALRFGYEVTSVEGFWAAANANELGDRKYLVMRHDVDGDPGTARAVFTIERDLGVHSSFYFRLVTVDFKLMCEIAAAGSEASYHFEEVATAAKEHRLRCRDEVVGRLNEIQERFRENLQRLRVQTGLSMTTVASHGDFVNRSLKMPNYELLDERLRTELAIALEVHDPMYLRMVTRRYSDTHYPRFWIPSAPGEAIAQGEKVIAILTHPKHWRVNLWETFKDDVGRTVQGLMYSLPRMSLKRR